MTRPKKFLVLAAFGAGIIAGAAAPALAHHQQALAQGSSQASTEILANRHGTSIPLSGPDQGNRHGT
ncbi:hypothetical protein LHJ74_22440 [Streptomyces sp. N2-109]|uniref:Secreted protein n=1 Tax=Streptomyces gossypii TaxID=2883101 RepID=A0ABT2JXL0_9ACTN|nr:hypothetical protein [Streptomyces gossypii]MCT2592635.1 hypothetical protein [Streptomyces gossypii]